MADERTAVADLVRLLGAHVAWQRTCGTESLPRSSDAPAIVRNRQEPKLDATLNPPTHPVAAPSGPLGSEEKLHRLGVLQEEIRPCTRCRLHEARTQTVFARGNPLASLVFVGEGPGRDEDKQGLPFVGAAGQLLDKIIAGMGLTEKDVYICNVVKCRPPENRPPLPDEMATCGPYLSRQLSYVQPTVIVALGKTAASYLLRASEPMAALRGKWHAYEGMAVRVTWHPAYLLRQPSAKRDTWEDMKVVLQRLGRSIPAKGG